MTGFDKRQNKRHEIGGAVEFEAYDNYYYGYILNTSLGGILIELYNDCPEIMTGKETNVSLFDLFSDSKYFFDAEIVRKADKEIALEFNKPLTDSQLFYLQEWFDMMDDPSKCV